MEVAMHFSETERQALLKLKGVGTTVIARLEQLGFSSLAELRGQETAVITKQIADMLGTTCWHNSPQANLAIQSVIDLANRHFPL
jgi:hypothetical protein